MITVKIPRISFWFLGIFLVVTSSGSIAYSKESSLAQSGRANSSVKSGILKTNEIWTGEILITGDVTVSKGIILEIVPGTIIKFKANFDDQDKGRLAVTINHSSIDVLGRLVAKGTKDLPIIFSSDAASPSVGDWASITFEGQTTVGDGIHTHQDSELSHCIIKDARMGLYINQAEPKILDCQIEHCNWGIYIASGGCQPVIKNNKFLKNEIAIEIGYASSKFIENNEFLENSKIWEVDHDSEPGVQCKVAVFEPLIASLGDKDPRVRGEAVKKLHNTGSIDDKRIVEPLISEALRGSDTDVQEAAKSILLKIKDPTAVEVYIALLDSDNDATQLEAAKILSGLKDARSVKVQPRVLKILEENAYLAEITKYDKYERPVSIILKNIEGKAVAKKELKYRIYNSTLIDREITSTIADELIHETVYEVGKPVNNMFLCLDSKGNIIRKNGKPLLVKPFRAKQKCVFHHVYDGMFRVQTIGKIYACENLPKDATKKCRYVW